jgi:hypothetical protein
LHNLDWVWVVGEANAKAVMEEGGVSGQCCVIRVRVFGGVEIPVAIVEADSTSKEPVGNSKSVKCSAGN